MNKSLTICAITATILILGSVSTKAQTTFQNPLLFSQQRSNTQTTEGETRVRIDLNRAKNLARQGAERANGGLGRYRAEPAMHGPIEESPYVDNGDDTWTFTFQGGAPNSRPDIETVVTVSETGTVTIDYNGAIRTTENTITQRRNATIDLNRAKNLARQAAERLNGGLGQYRAESSMHGPAEKSPYVDNGDGTWTFTFKGGTPTDQPTIETVVTVNQTGNVTVDYNSSIRQ
ncbi:MULTISPECIES: purine nucleoside permease [unclassified Coleofasciculus]|uniref:purine nucleoside permease n=1 Tax=unclassified Coleofasciculus TaxID=2692782 RepID=UPI001880BF49|nr:MULTISPECIES: purine nucleoside permease [unclassified Coleofasciculus]MBE9127372.1 purine nucleoside permease [Coleofasciculus sp. LEGE 07081]MBE9147362.1 purine nucleoside permease [Coleofasciculus sp. LEGE 07092]